MDLKFFTSPSSALRIAYHILFWICVLLFYTFFYGRLGNNYYASFIHLVFTFPIYIASTYITLYLIIPKFLLKKNYRAFFVASFYVVAGSAFLEIMITIFFMVTPASFLKMEKFGDFAPKTLDIYLRLVGIFIVVFFASSIKLVKYWYNIQRTNQSLVQQKLEAELNFLKSQVHPHFLFNTLNNLYALTLKKSDKSPEVVLKLSEILDYMLYDCNEEYVSLDKELKLISNYISLEKLRYDERVEISFEIEGRTSNKSIAPLILFPFIENSFKHGVSKNPDEAWINTTLIIKPNSIEFKVENNKPRTAKQQEEVSSGIGLKNVKKRLELLYAGNSKLNIEESDSKYSILLNINLS
jgi:two-component system, LytTR family, sensor kinase